MVEKIRIAVLHFLRETVSFLKNDTTLDDFIYPARRPAGEALPYETVDLQRFYPHGNPAFSADRPACGSSAIRNPGYELPCSYGSAF